MKKIICIVLTLVLYGTLTACNAHTEPTKDTIQVGDVEESVFEIQTPYCVLKYPTRWQEQVAIHVVDGDPCKVEFCVKDGGAPLFDIIFGQSEDYLLGELKLKNTTVPVHVKSYEPVEETVDEEAYYAMQEALNVILNRLYSEYDFTLGG